MSTSTVTTPDPFANQAPMLPRDPPPGAATMSGWLMVLLFGSVLAASILVQLPETVKCPFVLVPTDGADPIQAPYLVVVSNVRVAEGQEVKAGDELFVVHSDEIRAKHTQMQTFTEDLSAKESGAKKSEALFETQLSLKTSEITQAEREVEFRKRHCEASRELTRSYENLLANGGAPRNEVLKQQLETAQSEKDLGIAQKSLEMLRLDPERLKTERERQRGTEQAEIRNLQSRIAALKKDLEQTQGDRLSIRAPYDGIVISLTQKNAGNVVQPGQELCQLARRDAVPRVRLLLNENGMSRLATGQRTRLFLDAYPYQRYGTITGKVDWISPAAVALHDGTRFIATAPLDQTTIRAQGEQRPLRVGMKGEARITVGTITPIAYAFEPIRQLRENLKQ